jgi:hypothetical protein
VRTALRGGRREIALRAGAMPFVVRFVFVQLFVEVLSS